MDYIEIHHTLQKSVQQCAYKYVFSSAMGINRAVYLEKCAYYYSGMRFISGCFTQMKAVFFDVQS